jgi:hypothetical protein
MQKTSEIELKYYDVDDWMVLSGYLRSQYGLEQEYSEYEEGVSHKRDNERGKDRKPRKVREGKRVRLVFIKGVVDCANRNTASRLIGVDNKTFETWGRVGVSKRVKVWPDGLLCYRYL